MSARPAQVGDWFGECFDGEPDGLWWSPGRANLIGEHTDYNEGLVLPFAIERGTVVAASRRDDGMLVLFSRQAAGSAVSLRMDDLEPGTVTGWSAYPAAVAWALRQEGHPMTGASLAIDSDLPQGAGLASSAALECAVALALSGLHGLAIPRPELAALAHRAESEFVGIPCGIMDQSASLLCQAGAALLLDCRSGIGTQVPLGLAAAGAALMIVDTRVGHVLADGAYAVRRRECLAAARALGAGSLRDVDDVAELTALSGVLLRRARHVITENRRVRHCVAALRTGDVSLVGTLLTASHRSLREDFEVSWPAADAAVASAVAAGALGARMTGGGFGGSVLALAPAARLAQVRAAVEQDYVGHGWQPPAFADAAAGGGGRRLS